MLEIINNKSLNSGFYNPAPQEFKAYPRTEKGVKNAIRKFKKLALEADYIEDFRVAVYDGKKEYYNEIPFIGYIRRETILKNF